MQAQTCMLRIGLDVIKNTSQQISLSPAALKSHLWSRLLIHPQGVEGAHNFLGNSANTDSIRQAKGEPGQAPVPTPTLETNKQTIFYFQV